MYLISSHEMLKDAQRNNYAVPAFNIHNLETIQVIVETAAEMRSPVILAGTPGTYKHAGVDYLVSICKAAAKKHKLPLVLHLDHHESITDIEEKIHAGIRSAMIDASHSLLMRILKPLKLLLICVIVMASLLRQSWDCLGGRKTILLLMKPMHN